jgi:hypothetical protein
MLPQIDLISVFKAVTETLQENQTNLNEADTYNHDHGDNMVQTFQTITKAAANSKTKTPSAQLASASRTKEIRKIDPVQNPILIEATFGSKFFSPFRSSTNFEQRLNSADSGFLQLLGMNRSYTFNKDYFCHL